MQTHYWNSGLNGLKINAIGVTNLITFSISGLTQLKQVVRFPKSPIAQFGLNISVQIETQSFNLHQRHFKLIFVADNQNINNVY
jgi:hypothetical protein